MAGGSSPPSAAIFPVRLQLSRAKGFNLQRLSLETNGLPAINCTRPRKWGNLWRVGLVACACRSAGECTHNTFRRETAAEAVEEYRLWLQNGTRLRAQLGELRGNNLACWCALGDPCHVSDVLLPMANA